MCTPDFTGDFFLKKTKSKSPCFDHGVTLTNSIVLARTMLFLGGTHTLQIIAFQIECLQPAGLFFCFYGCKWQRD
jgi:hypothetical protein